MKILVTGGAGFIGSAVVRHVIADTGYQPHLLVGRGVQVDGHEQRHVHVSALLVAERGAA